VFGIFIGFKNFPVRRRTIIVIFLGLLQWPCHARKQSHKLLMLSS
jgi:hypothetical protein